MVSPGLPCAHSRIGAGGPSYAFAATESDYVDAGPAETCAGDEGGPGRSERHGADSRAGPLCEPMTNASSALVALSATFFDNQ
jgi:hypothetical protein